MLTLFCFIRENYTVVRMMEKLRYIFVLMLHFLVFLISTQVWDENLKLTATIDDAHSKSVFALAANSDTLFSGSQDGIIKSWSLEDFSAKSTLARGPREIWRLVYDSNILYAGDNRGMVELYARDRLLTDIHLTEPIRDLMAVGNLLYTLQDLYIVIRLIRSRYGDFERRKTIEGGQPMCIAGDKLLFCSRSGQDIHLRENSPDLNFKDLALIQDAHDQRIHSLLGMTKNADTLLFSAGEDKVVKQWRIQGNSLVKLSQTPVKTGVHAMAAGQNGEVYVGCRDGFIFRLDF